MSFRSQLVAFTLFWLMIVVNAVPIDWRTAQAISHSKNMGCLRFCGSAKTDASNSVDLADTITLPNVNKGHLLVIPVAAVAVLFYHIFRRNGKKVEEAT